ESVGPVPERPMPLGNDPALDGRWSHGVELDGCPAAMPRSSLQDPDRHILSCRNVEPGDRLARGFPDAGAIGEAPPWELPDLRVAGIGDDGHVLLRVVPPHEVTADRP